MWAIRHRSLSSHLPKKIETRSNNIYSHHQSVTLGQDYILDLYHFHYCQNRTDIFYEASQGSIYAEGLCLFQDKAFQAQNFLEEFCKADAVKRKKLYNDLSGHFSIIIHHCNVLYFLTDELGVQKLFYAGDMVAFSNSFLVASLYAGEHQLHPQSCYEYAFSGAPHRAQTLIKNITNGHGFKALCDGALKSFDAGMNASHLLTWDHKAEHIDDYVTASVNSITHTLYTHLKAQAQKPLLLISGGYDSRLLLAALMDIGIDFDLQYYDQGSKLETDIVHQLANYCGKKLDYLNKDMSVADEDLLCPIKELFAYDGLNQSSGIFSDGTDTQSRLGWRKRSYYFKWWARRDLS